MPEPDDLDAAVRAADPDRWLASRFIADPGLRADVIALYAFDAELRRIPQIVSEPLMAEIRLTWWREGIEAIGSGRSAPGHPVLVALAGVVARRGLPTARLEAMAEARLAASAWRRPSNAAIGKPSGLAAVCSIRGGTALTSTALATRPCG